MREFLYVEKYRPQEIEDCILPESTKKIFSKILESGDLPNLLLTGSAGVGKTTIAKVLCKKLNCDYIMINGSNEGRRIGELRDSIVSFASTVSLSGGKKVIILDEADYMNPESVQPYLRGFIEEFSQNCRFIFTCNFKNRIIPPLHSRCSVIDFSLSSDVKQQMAVDFFERCQYILKEENVKFKDKVLATLINKHFPDFRRVLNELQKYSVGGVIDEGILSNMDEVKFTKLFELLKNKSFTSMRKWVTENLDNDPSVIMRKVYDNIFDKMKDESIPHAVIIVADYQYKSAFAADQEINLVAFLTELMTLNFK
jgi:DNA polymerase III delta prime subunit